MDAALKLKPGLRTIRRIVQIWFVLLSLWMGYGLYRFALHIENPAAPVAVRPPGVEAFLPISGFMSLKLLLFAGAMDPVHPSALVIFIAAIIVSLLFKKAFCGWICPVGTLSEYLWKLGQRLMGRNLSFNTPADIGLMAIKYMLLFLFFFFTWIVMPMTIIWFYLMSDYYKAIDVRMLHFFLHMSALALTVFLAFGLLSVLYKNFWCRYLCPYGALLGLVSMASPFKVRRDEAKCIHCHACTRHCPSQIDVEAQQAVSSPECFGCMTCVSRCPSPGALGMSARLGAKRLPLTYAFAVAVLLAFYLVIAAGVATDNWRSNVTDEEYHRIGAASPRD